VFVVVVVVVVVCYFFPFVGVLLCVQSVRSFYLLHLKLRGVVNTFNIR
jgi:hypothetical protein